jgi:hypothetical protein
MRPLLLLAVLALPVSALAQVQIPPDENAVLVQRDIGNERWAINASLRDLDPLVITGNVFRPSSTPAFVWCDPTDVLGNPNDVGNATVVYDCFGSNACSSFSCPGWSFIREVLIPGTFFLP